MTRPLKPAEAEGPPADGHEFGILLRAAYFALRRCGNAQFESLDANGDQFMMLKILADGGPMNQLDLARRGGYDPSTATNMLKTMERQGYVLREEDPRDGRAKIVRLTDAGKARHRALWNASAALRRQLWECVRAEDRAVVTETLQCIVVRMDALRANAVQQRESS